MKIEFHTFGEMGSVLASNAPHALVLDWWTRLERVIREYGRAHGYSERLPVCRLIDDALGKDPLFKKGLIDELHQLRKRRNDIAHGSDLVLTAREAEEFSHRAWELGWLVIDCCEQSVAQH